MLVVKDGLPNLPITTFSIKYRCGVSNTEADALSRIKWPEALSENIDIDNGCMDTHVINAILTGAVTKSSD